MSVFSDLITVRDGEIFSHIWIKWQHNPMVPLAHCETCIVLDKCWFNKSRMPRLPLHPRCHCAYEVIPRPTPGLARAECAIEKFTGYIFNDEYLENGKQALFKKMGFTIEDAEYLKAEYEKQALEKYCNGEYTLDKLDRHGQRITIPIYLTKNGAATIIITGWMVRKDGLITNTTPFSGKRRG